MLNVCAADGFEYEIVDVMGKITDYQVRRVISEPRNEDRLFDIE